MPHWCTLTLAVCGGQKRSLPIPLRVRVRVRLRLCLTTALRILYWLNDLQANISGPTEDFHPPPPQLSLCADDCLSVSGEGAAHPVAYFNCVVSNADAARELFKSLYILINAEMKSKLAQLLDSPR